MPLDGHGPLFFILATVSAAAALIAPKPATYAVLYRSS